MAAFKASKLVCCAMLLITDSISVTPWLWSASFSTTLIEPLIFSVRWEKLCTVESTSCCPSRACSSAFCAALAVNSVSLATSSAADDISSIACVMRRVSSVCCCTILLLSSASFFTLRACSDVVSLLSRAAVINCCICLIMALKSRFKTANSS